MSVGVQEKACRRYAAEHWPDLPVVVYVDNAITAADARVVRPEFDRLIDAIRGGKVEHVVVREQSRITRQVEQWELICRTMQLAGIGVVHLTMGGTISVTEGSRLPGRILSVVDAEYVEQIRVKVRDTLEENATEGRPHGYPGYGFTAGKDAEGRPTLEPDPEQVWVVRRIIHELASGASLGLVARQLNDDGIPTARGARQWRPSAVRAIATAPRLVGLRVHKGATTEATWDPIVDRDEWDRVQCALGSPSRTIRNGRRRFLLTGGMTLCGNCDTPLVSARRRNGDADYTCPHPSRHDGGCGRCAILARHLEPHVISVVGGWIDRPEFVEEVNRHLAAGTEDATPLRSELAQIEGRLMTLAEEWAATMGEAASTLELAAARRGLLARQRTLRDQLDQIPVVEAVSAERISDAWRGAVEREDTEAMRAVIGVLAQPIRVERANRDGRRLTAAERAPVLPVWEV